MNAVKTKIRKAFAGASESYDAVAALQREAGRGLLGHLERPFEGSTIIDIGCGTGFLGVELFGGNQTSGASLWAVDIALPMLRKARSKLADCPAGVICADAEKLPFAAQSADVVLSNLAFQWCDSLDAVFAGVRQVLKPGGVFLFTTFGPKTLQELKSAWQAVENSPHVNTFTDDNALSELMLEAGFNEFTVYTQLQNNNYDSVLELLLELKRLGAHTVAGSSRRTLTGRNKLEAMMAAYPRDRNSNTINATFEIITVKAQI
jgi:malonyl-CoA O-methyltransferase